MRKRSYRIGVLLGVVALILSACGKNQHGGSVDESDGTPIPELTAKEKAELAAFVDPHLSISEQSSVIGKYAFVDPHHVVPEKLLNQALAYFDANRPRLSNDRVLTIVDFTPSSSRNRMYIIDMATGEASVLHVAHGRNSDPKDTGFATLFGNVVGSGKSSLGYYRTAELYNSAKHGLALRIDGLSTTNSNARARAIVVHGATYVTDSDVKMGRSLGCFAISTAMHESVINRLKDGSLIFAGVE